jgi:alcohol dehydrogenase (cytochrome c)
MRILFGVLATAILSFAGPLEGGKLFATRCAFCHGANADGGERGPSITAPISLRTDQELAALVRTGFPAAGMPAISLTNSEMADLLAHLRTLRPRRQSADRITVGAISGTIRNRSTHDMQVLADDGKIHLFRRPRPNDNWREVRGDRGWPTYHGDFSGNRHSPLQQITIANVRQLRTEWIYTIPGAQRLQVTPVVVDGVMYVTNVNEVHALDAGTGRRIWQYKRPRSKGVVIGDAASGINRGVALHGDRLFIVTDHAHLIALSRMTGALLWDVEMADYRQNYGATTAPLVVGDHVIAGVSGGDEGVRGFLSAFKVSTGELAWKFWTVPAPGDPLASTWQGKAIEHGCATTWLTGTYDPQLDLLYWPTGNPCPDYNGDERKGDNLYSDSVLALRPKTGELAWYFQFTPHDLHDWDAEQPPLLVDAEWEGQPNRKLLVQANRNGFLYVLDRTNGKFLRGSPFVKNLTWAKEIDAKGRPVVNPESVPTTAGVKACPAVEGATNWFSTAFHNGLFYVQALEKCNIYKKSPGVWEAGKSYYDGTTQDIPGEPGTKVLRAIELRTGRVAWEIEQVGPANSWGGVLSTAGGILFYGDDGGSFNAVDARTGAPLWRFPTNHLWKASPMTYSVDGKQYISVAAGANILSFALPE